MLKALLFSALATALYESAAAQSPPQAIEPPGLGMIDHPCPVIPPAAPRPLAEPGAIPATDPALAQSYQALSAYRQKNDWAALCKYKDENAALRGTRIRVVFMGDSITENWKRYDPSFFTGGIVGRGISGQTSPQMLARFYQDVVALKPRVVQIMAGTNDIAGNTGPNSPEDFRNTISAMVDIAKANGIEVILASIPPTSTFSWAPTLKPAPRVHELNTWLKAYAAERGAIYADYYTAMAEPDGAPAAGLTIDGVHPGTAGYKIMRSIATKAIADAERLGVTPR